MKAMFNLDSPKNFRLKMSCLVRAMTILGRDEHYS